MATKKVISYKNLKPKLPVTWTVVIGLLLDRLHAAEWIWGAIGLCVLIIWIYAIVMIINNDYEEIDIFENKEK